MKHPEPGDRVTARWQPGVRHGEVEAIYGPLRVKDCTEVAVRWNDDQSWKSYDADRFVSWGYGNWILRR